MSLSYLIRRVLAKPRLILDEMCRLYGKFASYLRRVLCKRRLIFPRINGANIFFGSIRVDVTSLSHCDSRDGRSCLVRLVSLSSWSLNVAARRSLERLPCFGSQSSFSGYALTKGSNPVDFLAFHLSFSVFHVQRKIVICATQITSFFFKKTNPYD